MTGSWRVRLAVEDDAERVGTIYAPFCRDGAASFEIQAPGTPEIAGRINATLAHYPWLVCEGKESIAGFAYAGRHRERAAYRWSTDVTVYVDRSYRRAGIGKALYTSLLALLQAQRFHTALAGIALPNPASVGLHAAMGFVPVGIYREAGYKLGAWHDVGWWQRPLAPATAEPQEPLPLTAIASSLQAAALARGSALIAR